MLDPPTPSTIQFEFKLTRSTFGFGFGFTIFHPNPFNKSGYEIQMSLNFSFASQEHRGVSEVREFEFPLHRGKKTEVPCIEGKKQNSYILVVSSTTW